MNRGAKACNFNSHKGSGVLSACYPPKILFIYLYLLIYIDIFLHACYPPFLMPSLITKWKKGKPYLYWVRSAWVHGHSRIVEQLYLGPRERVMEQMRAQFTSASPKEIPALRTVQLREFGASALFYAVAQELGLIELINAHVPPAPPGRRTSLSVGHYLVLAAINRAAWPKSKRAFAEWYQGTVLARLVPAGVDPEGLPSRARIVLYRRPLEARAKDSADLADLVHEVLVDQVATYLGLDPGVIEGDG